MVIERGVEPIGLDDKIGRLLRAGVLTGLSDFAFAMILFVFFYHTSVTRLWQGVAAVPLGKGAIDGGTTYAFAGVFFHFMVAFAWSAIFLFLVMRSQRVRSLLRTTAGQIKAAAVYGPFIWLVMSLVVIPVFLHKPPSITGRWWIQLVGHFPFVGLPMILSLARPGRAPAVPARE
jgi:hypothetical protein